MEKKKRVWKNCCSGFIQGCRKRQKRWSYRSFQGHFWIMKRNLKIFPGNVGDGGGGGNKKCPVIPYRISTYNELFDQIFVKNIEISNHSDISFYKKGTFGLLKKLGKGARAPVPPPPVPTLLVSLKYASCNYENR